MGVNYSHYIIPRDNTLRPMPEQIVALIKAWQVAGYVPEHGVIPVFKVDAWEEQFRKMRRATKQSSQPKGLFARWLSRTPTQPLQLLAESKPFLFPPTGESQEALSAPGSVITWELRDYLKLGTRYPLNKLPDPSWRPSYNLEIHLCDDFTNAVGVEAPCGELNTVCACGHDLKYETQGIPFEEHRVHRSCPSCGQSFRPQDQIVEMLVGSTGARYEERGGLCYRFAIVVNCGKDMPLLEEGGGLSDPRADPEFTEACRAALETELYEASLYS
jgi:hypothetical protein